MLEWVSNECKNEKAEWTKKDEIAETGDARGSMHSESEIVAPDGGWGWVIVFASFFMHLIGEC